MHVIPTYSSWLNQVERFFALITDKAIRRGSFSNVTQLVSENRSLRLVIQCHLPALPLDRYGRRYPGEAASTLLTNYRDRTLREVQPGHNILKSPEATRDAGT
ncbi:transposase [Bradyrhizobium sp. USDA 4518]